MAEQKGQTRKYISEKEAAEYLGIAERTLRSWRSNGRIDNKGTHPPRVYVRGKHVYYELGELKNGSETVHSTPTTLTAIRGGIASDDGCC